MLSESVISRRSSTTQSHFSMATSISGKACHAHLNFGLNIMMITTMARFSSTCGKSWWNWSHSKSPVLCKFFSHALDIQKRLSEKQFWQCSPSLPPNTHHSVHGGYSISTFSKIRQARVTASWQKVTKPSLELSSRESSSKKSYSRVSKPVKRSWCVRRSLATWKNYQRDKRQDPTSKPWTSLRA